MRLAHLLFLSSHHYQVAQVAFKAEVALVVVEVHLWLWTSSVSVDFVQCHYGKAGSRAFEYKQPMRCVFRSQPSPCYACETQHPKSFLLGLWPEGS
jgi:hypothetical protein